ncbi:hypothetical protein [Tahibacter amnicola]|uniref:Bacteriocin-like protein n=1 Tax=Tahibacter amnicola TaxID=2976241 RepID=A0ABY6BNV2_9GAMM|nr:hypothetical protein [Tahibacter amnicola]UXI70241.1 hypothetical protein N4264_11580 [Tahibacter amnicola]
MNEALRELNLEEIEMVAGGFDGVIICPPPRVWGPLGLVPPPSVVPPPR